MKRLLTALALVLIWATFAAAAPPISSSIQRVCSADPTSGACIAGGGFSVTNVPSTATVIAASTVGSAGASTAATLAAAVGKTTCIRGFSISVGAATTAGTSACTITPGSGNIAGATSLGYELVEGTTAAAAGANITEMFPDALCASATNVAITLTCGAVTSGGVIAVELHGWQQ